MHGNAPVAVKRDIVVDEQRRKTREAKGGTTRQAMSEKTTALVLFAVGGEESADSPSIGKGEKTTQREQRNRLFFNSLKRRCPPREGGTAPLIAPRGKKKSDERDEKEGVRTLFSGKGPRRAPERFLYMPGDLAGKKKTRKTLKKGYHNNNGKSVLSLRLNERKRIGKPNQTKSEEEGRAPRRRRKKGEACEEAGERT